MAEVPYSLVDSVIRVRGTATVTVESDNGTYRRSEPEVSDLVVELAHRASRTEGSQRILATGSGDQELSVKLTTDGRLESIEYKTAGVGAAVVTAAAKVISFVGTVIAGAAKRLGGFAEVHDATPPQPLRTHKELRDEWEKEHTDEKDLLNGYTDLVKTATTTLLAVRNDLASTNNVAQIRLLTRREYAVERALNDARAEIARIESLFAAWVFGLRTTQTATLETVVDVDRIPSRTEDVIPTPPSRSDAHYELWDDFGLMLQVVDDRRSPAFDPTHTPAFEDLTEESHLVRWRIPRRVELWVWKKAASGPELVSRSPVWIADEYSDTFAIEMRSTVFGEHGGAFTFNDDGSPAALKFNDESGIGAFADALAGVPETVVGAIEQAKKLTDTVAGIQDAAAEREKAAAERDVATAKARLELLGLNATAEDYVELQLAEQAVKLRTATRAVAPGAYALDDLKQELETVKTQNELDSQRRQASIDAQIADLQVELSRLEQEMKIAQAKHEIEHPGGDGAADSGDAPS